MTNFTFLFKQSFLAMLLSWGFVAVYAQPANLEGSVATGTFNNTNPLTDKGAFRQARIQAMWTGTANYLFDTAPANYNPQWTGSNAPDFARVVNTIYNGGYYYTGGGWNVDHTTAVTSGTYYTFNIQENAAANNKMAVLATTYNPVNITRLVRTPTTPMAGTPASVAITLAATPSAGEFVHLRYSTDGFATSFIVTVTMSGNKGTAMIPGFAAATNVAYYVFTSNNATPPANNDADMHTLNINNNGNLNYTYTVGATFSTYEMENFTGAYAAITGGTAGPVGDDAISANIALPFNFSYGGVNYVAATNFFQICTNGWVGLNTGTAAAQSAANNNLFSTTAPNIVIAPWWDDLTTGTGTISYLLTGMAPNQVLTIEFTNTLSYFTGSTRTLNYQIKLYQTTNVVEFLYGSKSAALAYISESATRGLEWGVGGLGNYLDATTGSRGQVGNGMLNSEEFSANHVRFYPTSTAPTALPAGTYTVGTGSSDYPTLTRAFADLNQRGIAGAVTLSVANGTYNVASGEIFPITLGPVAGTSVSNTITVNGNNSTFSYYGAPGGNIVVSSAPATGTLAFSNTTEPILGFVGTDYTTVQNFTLSHVNTAAFSTQPKVDRGIGVANATAVDGATNNVFKNLTITLDRTNTSSHGIASAVPVAPTSLAGGNSNNKYLDFTITNAYSGILLTGSTTFPDQTNEIGTMLCASTNTIGANLADDIGNSTLAAYGIKTISQAGVKIYNNLVRNVTGISTLTVDGIWMDNTGSLTASVGTCEIYNNKVQTIRNTSATAGVVTGIRANLTNNVASISRVYNNFVADLQSASTATTTRRIIGIGAQIAGVGTSATHNIHFNSVSLNSTNLACPNTCFEIGTGVGAAAIYNVRNNIFANLTAAQTGAAYHTCWAATAANSIGGTGSVSNNNVFYLPNPTNGNIGVGGTITPTYYPTLADWQTTNSAMPDPASFEADPGFAGTTDLHASTAAINGAADMTGITWVLQDIDCATRTAPHDIGADDYTPTTLDIGAVAVVSPAAVGCYTASETVIITIKNFAVVTHNFAANPVTVNVTVNLPGGGTATLTAIANTGTLPSAGTRDVTMSTTLNMSASGAYVFSATTVLTGDQNGANNTMNPTASRTVVAPIVLPSNVDFTGFTGANLTTLFPQWREAVGAAQPIGATSAWTSSGAITTTSAKVNLSLATKREWIVGAKFIPTSCSRLLFKTAVTGTSVNTAYVVGATNDDAFDVMISTDCGVSYTSIYNYLPSTNGLTNSLSSNIIDLSAYAGQEAIIGFLASEGAVDDIDAYDLHLDDVEIKNLPALDVAATTIAVTACYTATETATVTIQNLGCTTLNFVTNPVTVSINYTLNGIAQTPISTVVNTGTLVYGATQAVNLTMNMTAAGVYSLSGNAALTGDGTAGNDNTTAIGKVTPDFTASPSAATVCGTSTINLFSTVTGIVPITILSENWTSGTLGAWVGTPATNWVVGAAYIPTGAVAPSAYFSFTPVQTNYSHELVSPIIDATNYANILFDYLLFLNNFSLATVEQFEVAYKTTASGTWTILENFTNAAGTQQLPRTNQVLTGMAGQQFQIRFRAYGANSNNVNGWAFDNLIIRGALNPTFAWTSSPSGFTSTLQNPTGVSIAANTTYNVVTTIAGCTKSTNTSVVVNTPATANAGTAPAPVCGQTNVTFTPSGSAPGTWMGGGGSFAGNVYTPVAGDVTSTPITFTYTVADPDGAGPCMAVSSTTTARFDQTVTSTAGASKMGCNTATVTMTPTAPVIGTGAWTGGMGTFAGNVYTPHATESANGAIITATWTVTNGTCSAASTATITIYAPVTSTAGANKTGCNTATVTMTPTPPSVGTGAWTGGAGSFAGNVYTPSAGESSGGAVITATWTVTNGTCSATSTATITIYAPVTSNAGMDMEGCNTATVTMMPTTPMVGTGAWTGGMGMFAGNVYTPHATESANGAVITATWTVTNGTCVATDNAVITIYAPVTSNAGMDMEGCNTATVTMMPTTPMVGTGAWTGGMGMFAGNVYTPHATESANGAVITATWTVTNGPCSATDAAVITIYAPVTSNAGMDMEGCNTAPVTMMPTTPMVGTGAWTGGMGVFAGNVYTPHATESANGAVITATWTVTNGTCVATDNAVITIYAPVTSNAGMDMEGCNTATVTMMPTTPMVGTGAWTGGMGMFAGNVYTPHATESANGAVITATWTVTNGTCSATDAAVITIYAPVTSNAGMDMEGCNTATITMMPTTPSLGTGAWTGGMGMFAGNVYTPDASESASGAVITATWTVTNGTCSATDNAVMTVYAPVTADAGMDKSTCANTMVTMTPAAPSVGTGLWTGGAGTFVGNNYTPTGGESNSTITGTWTVTNGTCSAMDMAIIVVDTTAPTIATISNQTLALDSLCAATLPDYTGIATANDNCSGFMVTQSPVAGTAIYGAGTTTVTMTVTDAAGKTASTSFGVMRNLYSTMISADGMTTFCMDSTVNLTASSNGSYGYQWYKDAAMISGATSATIIADATGLYNVEVTVTGGCVLTSNAIAVTEVTQPAAPTITSNPADVSGVVTICTGTVATLSGPAASEYLWYKAGIIVNYSAVTPNYMVAGPTGSDVYTLAVVPTGMSCLSAQSSAITVVRTAPLAIITPAGPTTFCANMPTTLNANTGAGYTYSWVGNNTAGQITSSFTPTVSGNYSVAVSNAMGCATRSSKVIINVLALPVANAGVDKSICTNVSATIGTVGNAANTYAWSPNTNLSSAAIAMPVASPTAAGLIAYTLTVTGANGCMNTDMVNVTGAALPTTPTLTATTSPVCQGASVMVTPSAPGASSVAWYKNGTSLYVKLPTYTPAFTMPTVAPDMYTITAKNAAGCVSPVSNSVSVMINAAAVPTISSTPAAIGTWISICNLSGNTGSVALTANVSAGTPTYQWEQFVSGSYTAVGSGNTYTANVATTPASSNNKRFRVVATYSNGCVKTSAIRNVRVLTSGCTPRTIEDTKGNSDLTEIVIESDMLSAYPNPTEGLLNVSVENCESSYGELVLSNALGQVVETRLMTIENGKGAEVLDLSEMAAGIYTLSFRTDNSQKVQKVVKE